MTKYVHGHGGIFVHFFLEAPASEFRLERIDADLHFRNAARIENTLKQNRDGGWGTFEQPAVPEAETQKKEKARPKGKSSVLFKFHFAGGQQTEYCVGIKAAQTGTSCRQGGFPEKTVGKVRLFRLEGVVFGAQRSQQVLFFQFFIHGIRLLSE